MGLRFRRTLQLLPWLRLNVFRSGASVSVGPRGAHITTGTAGTRATAGIPGTGLSYTQQLQPGASTGGRPRTRPWAWWWLAGICAFAAVCYLLRG